MSGKVSGEKVAGQVYSPQKVSGVVNGPIALDKSLTKNGYAADAKATGDAIRAVNVTPQMFGAVADGVHDDTSAVQAAINSGSAVYFPKGTYLIAATLTIKGGVRLYGAGIQVATIKYTGSGYLFHIKAEYKNHPIIEKMNFVGGTNSSFIKCISDDGSWGGCFTLRDFHVQYFNVEWMRLVSAFKVLVENGSFKTLGKCVMTTWDELPTSSNFNNLITFRNCLISCPNYDGGDMPVMFELFNVREILFEQCALEHCTVMFKDFITDTWKNSSNYDASTTIATGIKLNECWLETVGAVYDFSYHSGIPIATNCKYVSTTMFANSTAVNEPNFLYGHDEMWFRNGETSSIVSAINGTEKVLWQTNIKNTSDSQGANFYQHKVSTKEVVHNVPLNTNVKQVHGDKTLKMQLKSITRYSDVCCRALQTIIFAYPGSGSAKTTNVWQCEWLAFDNSYYLVKQPTRIYSYGSGTSATAVESVARGESGEIVATTDQETLTLAIITEYHFNSVTR